MGDLLACAVSAGAGFVGVYGMHPVGYGIFCGWGGDTLRGLLTLAAALWGIVVTNGMIAGFKYGIGMLTFLVICELAGGRRRLGQVGAGLVAGASLLVMNLTTYLLAPTGDGELVMGVLESILAGALSVLVSYVRENRILAPRPPLEQGKRAAGELRLKESAHMLNRLSDSFERLPVKKEVLNSQDVDDMFDELVGRCCKKCENYDRCWNQFYETTSHEAYELFCRLDQGETAGELAVTSELAQSCPHYPLLMSRARQIFDRTKHNFLWYNRLIENRQAVALQLNEMARMMREAAEEIGSQRELSGELATAIRRKLKGRLVEVGTIVVKKGRGGRDEYVLGLRTARNRCVPVRDVAACLSEVLGKPYNADKESRLILNREEEQVLFVERPNYRIISGCARVAKEGERVSGDNFSFCQSNGQLAACLSDGMGSGLAASQSSELVIELLEGFLEAGFCKETALRMINATLVMNNQNGKYSTMDVAEVDLYAGMCEFVKMGAPASFIKREHGVEVVRLESLPVGAFYDQGFDSATKPLYDGDYVIMVSDGVLAPLPRQMTEQVMAGMISEVDSLNPKEMANQILDRVLQECGYHPADDMTVLVFGVGKDYN